MAPVGVVHDPQQAGQGASPQGQNGAQEQDLGVPPGMVDEAWRDDQHEAGEAGG